MSEFTLEVQLAGDSISVDVSLEADSHQAEVQHNSVIANYFDGINGGDPDTVFTGGVDGGNP